MRDFPNIEKLPGKKHYTGYATFMGKPVVYHVQRVKARFHAWEATPANGVWKIGGKWVPSHRGQTLAEISASLASL